eukprot:gene7314-9723_t
MSCDKSSIELPYKGFSKERVLSSKFLCIFDLRRKRSTTTTATTTAKIEQETITAVSEDSEPFEDEDTSESTFRTASIPWTTPLLASRSAWITR